MRLKSLKLAGFKSFVDPTTVYFPSNLCAVVGPNGCGKSNIIDAVRWVMGESSAMNLMDTLRLQLKVVTLPALYEGGNALTEIPQTRRTTKCTWWITIWASQ